MQFFLKQKAKSLLWLNVSKRSSQGCPRENEFGTQKLCVHNVRLIKGFHAQWESSHSANDKGMVCRDSFTAFEMCKVSLKQCLPSGDTTVNIYGLTRGNRHYSLSAPTVASFCVSLCLILFMFGSYLIEWDAFIYAFMDLHTAVEIKCNELFFIIKLFFWICYLFG